MFKLWVIVIAYGFMDLPVSKYPIQVKSPIFSTFASEKSCINHLKDVYKSSKNSPIKNYSFYWADDMNNKNILKKVENLEDKTSGVKGYVNEYWQCVELDISGINERFRSGRFENFDFYVKEYDKKIRPLTKEKMEELKKEKRQKK